MAPGGGYEVAAWRAGGALFERHARLRPGGGGPSLPRHAHEEYQVGLHANAGGRYDYRGAWRDVPAGGLTVLHPGEPHATGDGRDLPAGAAFRTLYLPAAVVAEAAAELAGDPRRRAPFFGDDPLLPDPALASLYRGLHEAAERGAPRLETETLLAAFLARLVGAAGRVDAPPPRGRPTPTRGLLSRVRDLIHAEAARDLPLAELAAVAGLGRHHLCRAFARQFGLPPHRYQTQLRVMRAKAMLLEGATAAAAAAAVGFADRSHLTRHFARVVGVPPAAYRPRVSRNNVHHPPPRAGG